MIDRRSFDGTPDWYKDAIVYELRVRSFYDSNGDGIGDFPGLTAKLDYLQDLGVSALWLLPFYPSPLRDDGYDISDYTDVHSAYGTLADFDRFLDEAHRRKLRVITELVLNHTSDQHPWFQKARRAPPGSPERERYVWSDTPERYRHARIIFKDFEPSNWSWDPVAHAYFWHRFYAHQPDLNFANPEVREAMLKVLEFWLDRGVDGLRLDAVPYLFEREGTSCENLPETHSFLRSLRAHVDARYEGRMLLAEANQWPEDAVAYFGRGDECHMAFHFPVMPRIFMSIHAEDRFPLVDILHQTPEIPEGCQWALFLRNHDELTLEMVTDEERDAMYRAYAAEPVMRLNLGIRRRLSPLAGNDRRRIELMNALLFALPGTPVVYYGDEIGMGDNVFLGDRDGVRTPMQWSSDRNAGFSRANPQRLVLPVIIDPEYHFEAINVEAQQEAPSSLLWFMKRLIAIRKRFLAFGRGPIELFAPENPRILAFARRYEGEAVLIVANLSRLVQFVELDLSTFAGLVPIELFGRSELPQVGTARYPLTLAGHGFYLLSLERPAPRSMRIGDFAAPRLEELERPWDRALAVERNPALADALAGFALAHTWCTTRERRVEGARIADAIPIPDAGTSSRATSTPLPFVGEPASAAIVILEMSFTGGDRERYAIPLAHARGAQAEAIQQRSPDAVVAVVAGAEHEILYDLAADQAISRAVLEALLGRTRTRGRSGSLVSWKAPTLAPCAEEPVEERGVESARGPVLFGTRVSAYMPRRVEEGPTPGLELSRFLAAHPSHARVPALLGTIEYVAGRREPVTIGVVRAAVAAEADGRVHAQDELAHFFERALARAREAPPPSPRPFHPLRLAGEEPATPARDAVGAYLDTASVIGRRTAELHLALAASSDEPAFAPEPYSPFEQRAAYQTARTLARRGLRELAAHVGDLAPEERPIAEQVLAREQRVLDRLGALLALHLTALRTRHHGAYQLSRLFYASNDVVISDLDAESERPTSERRRKATPLRDVASMIQSFHEVAFATLADPTRVRPEDRAAARPWADLWWWSTSTVFLGTYLAAAREGSFLPADRDELAVLLDTFLLKAGFAALSAALAAGSGAVALAFVARLLEEG